MGNSDDSLALCGCLILVLILNLALGGWSVNYLITFVGGDALPTLISVIVGAFAGEITVPLAVIVLALRWAGLV